jgi:hypothetical protein
MKREEPGSTSGDSGIALILRGPSKTMKGNVSEICGCGTSPQLFSE